MSHPYTKLPFHAFWRSGVAKADITRFKGLFRPKFPITDEMSFATAGSCFAQHIGRFLRMAGCDVLEAEQPPELMSKPLAHQFGYGLFSGRYGNIYTTRQMRQLLEDVATGFTDKRYVWSKGKQFVDAFRPTVEPEGLKSEDGVLLHRAYHLKRTSQMLKQADLFVFTLGLTETWVDAETGRAFPSCPGVAAGTFDADQHLFYNMPTADILADLGDIRRALKRFNPDMKLLLTVSPVPLTATAADDHVLSATTWSKSALRAAAGEFAREHDDVDYFPSFELVTSHATGGPWFDANLRGVREDAVERVMSIFFDSTGLAPMDEHTAPPQPTDSAAEEDAGSDTDLICDDLLLDAFAEPDT
ncbi:MAG: GSCFA domain-containing protein [Paracoccaceae bacterium]|jgi:hypothetical protein|nr:GSCFA domain-containing protein [Paracoccaceae bacterium]